MLVLSLAVVFGAAGPSSAGFVYDGCGSVQPQEDCDNTGEAFWTRARDMCVAGGGHVDSSGYWVQGKMNGVYVGIKCA